MVINLRDLKQFKDSQYARHLVLKSDNVEIIVVCWMPGQGSAVHHHGKSDGMIVVLEGAIQNTNYYPDGREDTCIWRPGDCGHTPVGVSHKVVNTSDDKVVTLHIYAPPLAPELRGFDLGYDNEVEVQEVQLPKDVVRFIMACVPKTPAEAAVQQELNPKNLI